ncbi:MAG: DUF3592 domain-containing protein [Candidatus Melainabacteria bacterium]|nr:DUF3592 domain-containing protein [Candidatus Melainabacteria bacterium]
MFQPLKQIYNLIVKSEKRREQKRDRLGKIFLGYMMIPVVIGTCLLSFNAFGQTSWTHATGSVLKTRIEDPPEGKSGLYSLILTYGYEAAGKSFRGSAPLTHDRKRVALEHKQEDEFPVGANIQIAYNPADPSESCLTRGSAIMPYFFLVLAALLTFASYKLIRTKPIPSSVPSEDY